MLSSSAFRSTESSELTFWAMVLVVVPWGVTFIVYVILLLAYFLVTFMSYLRQESGIPIMSLSSLSARCIFALCVTINCPLDPTEPNGLDLGNHQVWCALVAFFLGTPVMGIRCPSLWGHSVYPFHVTQSMPSSAISPKEREAYTGVVRLLSTLCSCSKRVHMY